MLRNRRAESRWFLHDAAAEVVRYAFPKHLKGRGLSEDTLTKARADGGALTTVARMLLDTNLPDEADAIMQFLADVRERAHPTYPKRPIEEWHRIEHAANAAEDAATLEYIASPSKDNALTLFRASLAESVAEQGRRVALLEKHA